ncbi:MAG: hypothetical protein EOS58_22700 [Mesorhizobium sp.]|nr:MAG: hypothetical protein EOS58_22700 [Mesorhizobium sp.]
MFDFLDQYNIRARLFPAVLAIAPALAFALLAVSWNQLGLTETLTTLAVMVLFFGFSDLARRFGKRIEPSIFAALGGKPSVSILRYDDPTLDPMTKARYRNFLGASIGETPPTAESERQRPEEADAFYERCGNWLRENTRSKSFKILFEENITYGFRRNLYGLKWPGLLLNAAIVLLCLVVLDQGGTPFTLSSIVHAKIFPVIVIAAIHAFYFAVWVRKKPVMAAAKQYARQLILSCEGLMAEAGRR